MISKMKRNNITCAVKLNHLMKKILLLSVIAMPTHAQKITIFSVNTPDPNLYAEFIGNGSSSTPPASWTNTIGHSGSMAAQSHTTHVLYRTGLLYQPYVTYWEATWYAPVQRLNQTYNSTLTCTAKNGETITMPLISAGEYVKGWMDLGLASHPIKVDTIYGNTGDKGISLVNVTEIGAAYGLNVEVGNDLFNKNVGVASTAKCYNGPAKLAINYKTTVSLNNYGQINEINASLQKIYHIKIYNKSANAGIIASPSNIDCGMITNKTYKSCGIVHITQADGNELVPGTILNASLQGTSPPLFLLGKKNSDYIPITTTPSSLPFTGRKLDIVIDPSRSIAKPGKAEGRILIEAIFP